MSIVPFAFLGVFITLLIHGLPLSMLVLIGLTGLMGVVVNNSILIVETIHRRKEQTEETDLKTLVIASCRTRLRPILLTSFTTFFGIIPLGYGIGGHEPFLEHVALTFGWGLLFSSIISLFLAPTVFVVIERGKLWVLRKLGREESKEFTDEPQSPPEEKKVVTRVTASSHDR